MIDKVLTIFKTSKAEIRPHFWITGGSGAGKSFQLQQAVIRARLQYMEINAAALTKEGTSGNSLSKALAPALQFGGKPTVCFVDEFDKLFISGNSNSELAHETTNGVQNEFLKVLESTTAQVYGDYGKYISAKVDNILFVFAGAFNGEPDITLDRMREFGIKTEFLGRVGLIHNIKRPTIADLLAILNKSPLLAQYCTLFPDTNRQEVINLISAFITENYEQNTLGARIISNLVHQYFIHGELTDDEVKQSTFQEGYL